jgi:hypothetical protein
MNGQECLLAGGERTWPEKGQYTPLIRSRRLRRVSRGKHLPDYFAIKGSSPGSSLCFQTS